MNQIDEIKPIVPYRPNLPILGGLILFTVILGTTRLGYIPVPTEAIHATSMHLPTIVASVVEGWPAGMIVGMVFGITSMYMAGSPMSSDPLVAMVPRLLVGLTPYLAYILLSRFNEYVRLAVAAVVGTLTNTVGFLGMSVILGYLNWDTALYIAWVHGLPECVVAIVITIPAVFLMRRVKVFLTQFTQ